MEVLLRDSLKGEQDRLVRETEVPLLFRGQGAVRALMDFQRKLEKIRGSLRMDINLIGDEEDD